MQANSTQKNGKAPADRLGLDLLAVCQPLCHRTATHRKYMNYLKGHIINIVSFILDFLFCMEKYIKIEL